MKNINETLFDSKKHWFATLFASVLFSLPVFIIFCPTGYQSEYEVNKWYIYLAIVGITLGLNQIYHRLEDHEETIKKMNEEIESLKEEIGELKK